MISLSFVCLSVCRISQKRVLVHVSIQTDPFPLLLPSDFQIHHCNINIPILCLLKETKNNLHWDTFLAL